MGILAKNATANLFNDIKIVPITVAGSGTTTTATADTELIGGVITGIVPASGTAANAVVQSVVLTSSTGVLVITLGAATTNAATYNVIVRLASGNIA